MNKTHSLKHFVYLVGLHIYYKMIHGPYNLKIVVKFSIRREVVIYEGSAVYHVKVNLLPIVLVKRVRKISETDY